MSQSVQSQKKDDDKGPRDSELAGRPTIERKGKQERRLRNYLLDKGFQLKYTGIVIGVTALLSAVLGYYLHQQIVASQRTILARNLGAATVVVQPGDTEGHNKLLTKIDREITEAYKTKVAVVVKVNNAPAGGEAEFYQESFDDESNRITLVLVVSLVVFLLVLAIVWVYLTHRIAGPVYKLKLLFSKIDGKNLRIESRLRKGDELQDAFESFERMVARLRKDRERRAAKLSEIAEAIEGENEESAKQLRKLGSELLDSVAAPDND